MVLEELFNLNVCAQLLLLCLDTIHGNRGTFLSECLVPSYYSSVFHFMTSGQLELVFFQFKFLVGTLASLRNPAKKPMCHFNICSGRVGSDVSIMAVVAALRRVGHLDVRTSMTIPKAIGPIENGKLSLQLQPAEPNGFFGMSFIRQAPIDAELSIKRRSVMKLQFCRIS